MERLSNSTNNSSVSHLHSDDNVESVENFGKSESVESNETSSAEEVAQIEHFAEQLVGHMAKDQQEHNHATSSHSNNDNTFHPDPTEGLQVIDNKYSVSVFIINESDS